MQADGSERKIVEAARSRPSRRPAASGAPPPEPHLAAREHRGRGPPLVPRLLDVGDRQPRAARRARRPEARAPADPVRDAAGGAALHARLLEVGRRGRRGAQALPPARRQRGLRLDGADGPGFLAALPARRRPGQLRLDRRRPAGRLPLHRGAPHAARRGDAARHRPRDGRLRAQLRRRHDGAGRAAVALPEPARERLVGDRGGHGHQRAAAQSARADRRAHARGARPRLHARRPAREDAGPRLPDRRDHLRPRGDPRRLRHRPRPAHRARARRDRDEQARRADRGDRDPVHGEQGVDAGADRRARARGQDRRRRRPARREQPRRHADRDRAQEGRARRRGAEPALQADADADHVRREPARARERPAPDALAQGGAPALHRLPARGGGAARHLRPRPGRGARAPARGLRDRARAPRRGDRDHPRRRGHGRRAHRADRPLRALRAPGERDPRNATAFAHRDGAPARAGRARRKCARR